MSGAAPEDTMGGDRVNVFARVRPLGSARAESDSEAVRLDGDTNITVDDIEGAINESLRGSSGASLGDALKASAQRKTFEFDGVFGGESEQAEVFKEVGLPVVDAVLAGYHGCVFAYGQTGSGKTYSLLHGGSAAQSFQDSGLLPRLAATLYVKAARDVAHDYTVFASQRVTGVRHVGGIHGNTKGPRGGRARRAHVDESL